jgi:hypothetical protein
MFGLGDTPLCSDVVNMTGIQGPVQCLDDSGNASVATPGGTASNELNAIYNTLLNVAAQTPGTPQGPAAGISTTTWIIIGVAVVGFGLLMAGGRR